MKHRLMRKGEDWSRTLPRPIVIRNGKTLRRLSECRSYVLSLDEGEQAQPYWQRMATLLLDAAKGGDIEEVVLQFERILIQQNKLVLS